MVVVVVLVVVLVILLVVLVVVLVLVVLLLFVGSLLGELVHASDWFLFPHRQGGAGGSHAEGGAGAAGAGGGRGDPTMTIVVILPFFDFLIVAFPLFRSSGFTIGNASSSPM